MSRARRISRLAIVALVLGVAAPMAAADCMPAVSHDAVHEGPIYNRTPSVTDAPARGQRGSDPVAHWNFDEGSGNIAHDLSGHGHDGTLHGGASWICGVSGAGIDLDGAAYVEVPDADDLSFGNYIADRPFTLAAWIMHRTCGSAPDDIIAKYDTRDPNWAPEYMFRVDCDNTLFIMLTDACGDWRLAVRTDAALDSQWHFVAATYNGSSNVTGLALYVDGVAQGTTVVLDDPHYVAMDPTWAPLTIGVGRASSPAWDEYFNGQIDEVGIYARALSADEILALYSASWPCRGDCDCDGQVNFSDIDLFVAAIPDDYDAWAALYAQRHEGAQPSCPFANCDANADRHVNFADIDPFVALIPSTCP